MGRLLVTGCDGFIGRALCARAAADGRTLRCALFESMERMEVTNPEAAEILKPLDVVVVGNIGPETDWSETLRDVDAVVHLAARAHVLSETAADPFEAFREVNTHGATRLARCAVEAGVRRMVFISSIGVHGSVNTDGPFTEQSMLRPDKPYAVSKLDAEVNLRELAAQHQLELVIVRPPLVYGPHVKGNFLRLLNWSAKGVPLPLGSVQNRRTFIGRDNLVDVLLRCVDHPDAGGKTFVVGDDEVISTPDLLREIGERLGVPSRLIPVPPSLLRGVAALLGRGEDAERLVGNLVVDNALVKRTLEWTPPVSLRDGLELMCRWYCSEKENIS